MHTFTVYDRGTKNFMQSFGLMLLLVLIVSRRWTIVQYIQPRLPAFIGMYYSVIEAVVGILLFLAIAYVMFFFNKRTMIVESHQITILKRQELLYTFVKTDIKECVLAQRPTRKGAPQSYHLVLYRNDGGSSSYGVQRTDVELVKQSLESYGYVVREQKLNLLRGVS